MGALSVDREIAGQRGKRARHAIKTGSGAQMNPSIMYRRFGGIYRSWPTSTLRVINNLPAMLYHDLPRRNGSTKPAVPRRHVPPELLSEGANFLAKPSVPRRSFRAKAGVLMRLNAVPRSIAVGLGERYSATLNEGSDLHSVRSARSYLRGLSPADWQRSAPAHAGMSGDDYRAVWSLLAGERG